MIIVTLALCLGISYPTLCSIDSEIPTLKKLCGEKIAFYLRTKPSLLVDTRKSKTDIQDPFTEAVSKLPLELLRPIENSLFYRDKKFNIHYNLRAITDTFLCAGTEQPQGEIIISPNQTCFCENKDDSLVLFVKNNDLTFSKKQLVNKSDRYHDYVPLFFNDESTELFFKVMKEATYETLKKIKKVNIQSGKIQSVHAYSSKPLITCLPLMQQLLIVNKKMMKVYDISKKKSKYVYKIPLSSDFDNVISSSHGKYVAGAREDSIVLYTQHNKKLVEWSHIPVGKPLRSVVFDPTEKYIAFSTKNNADDIFSAGYIYIYGLQTKECLWATHAHGHIAQLWWLKKELVMKDCSRNVLRLNTDVLLKIKEYRYKQTTKQ